jgi:hypothetical protein
MARNRRAASGTIRVQRQSRRGRCLRCKDQPQWDDSPFCEDCHLSDCAICGATFHFPDLDEDLECPTCAGGLDS